MVSVFDIAVTLLLAVVIIALAVRGTRERTSKMKTATDDYIQCETLARQRKAGRTTWWPLPIGENPGQSTS